MNLTSEKTVRITATTHPALYECLQLIVTAGEREAQGAAAYQWPESTAHEAEFAQLVLADLPHSELVAMAIGSREAQETLAARSRDLRAVHEWLDRVFPTWRRDTRLGRV